LPNPVYIYIYIYIYIYMHLLVEKINIKRVPVFRTLKMEAAISFDASVRMCRAIL